MNEEKTLKVSGMSCNACVRHVTRALSGIQGLQIKEVAWVRPASLMTTLSFVTKR